VAAPVEHTIFRGVESAANSRAKPANNASVPDERPKDLRIGIVVSYTPTLFWSTKADWLRNSNSEIRNPKQIQNVGYSKLKTSGWSALDPSLPPKAIIRLGASLAPFSRRESACCYCSF
jgi:hypothetical protein